MANAVINLRMFDPFLDMFFGFGRRRLESARLGHVRLCPTSVRFVKPNRPPPNGNQLLCYTISSGHFGSACINPRPYGFLTVRLSRITTMPLALSVLIDRPAPW